MLARDGVPRHHKLTLDSMHWREFRYPPTFSWNNAFRYLGNYLERKNSTVTFYKVDDPGIELFQIPIKAPPGIRLFTKVELGANQVMCIYAAVNANGSAIISNAHLSPANLDPSYKGELPEGNGDFYDFRYRVTRYVSVIDSNQVYTCNDKALTDLSTLIQSIRAANKYQQN